MSHDRVRLSALVDGELDHEARDRLLAHLAQCDECRSAVESERRVKALLSGLPGSHPSGDFMTRLRQIGAAAEAMSDTDLGPGSEPSAESPLAPVLAGSAGRAPRVHRSPVPAARPLRPYHHPAAWNLPGRPARTSGRSTRPLMVGFAGAASFAGMALVTAFTIGGEPAPAQQAEVKPPIQRYTVQHSNRAVELPWSDPGAVTASFGEGWLGPAVYGTGRR